MVCGKMYGKIETCQIGVTIGVVLDIDPPDYGSVLWLNLW